jgi:hypothetical protein
VLDSFSHDVLARRLEVRRKRFPPYSSLYLEKFALMHAAKKRGACGVHTFMKHGFLGSIVYLLVRNAS